MLEHPLAVLGVQHLGVPLHAGEAAVVVLERRDRRAPSVDGEHGEALGRRATESPWDIHTLCSAGMPASSVPALGDGDRRAAVLARAGVGDLAAERLGHRLEAVAHAEDGDAGLEERRVERGAPSA